MFQIFFLFTAACYFDTPYGYLIDWWDKELSAESKERILTNFKACTNSEQYSVCFWVDWKSFGPYLEAMTNAQLFDIVLNCWYKPNQTVCGLNSCITNANEYFITAKFKTGSCKQKDFSTPWVENNPTKRHNHFEWPSNSAYAKYSDGTKVNATEKPPECIKFWLRRNVFPGDHIIICGGGAGGDVRGALEYGCSVTIIEQDPRQYEHLCNLVLTWDAEQAKAKRAKEMLEASEAAALQLLVEEPAGEEDKMEIE
jgi:hypothetical protein